MKKEDRSRSGGIGIRARLRGVWIILGGSSPPYDIYFLRVVKIRLKIIGFQDSCDGNFIQTMPNYRAIEADLYKSRWQLELFFKWTKGNLKIKKFLGRSKNAVKTQICIAMIAFVLLKIAEELKAVCSKISAKNSFI